MKVKIGNILVDNVTSDEAIEKIESFIKNRKPSLVITPNADHVVMVREDTLFLEIYMKADLVLADGMSLIFASRLLKTPIKEKISGSDLFPLFCKIAAQKGYRLFFLGGQPGACIKTAENMKEKYQNLIVAGTYSPPFGFEHDKHEMKKINDMIKRANPDILFVGLGSPKQEKWIYRNYNEIAVPVSIGIGATFEFYSGMVKRAPRWMQRCGLEWFWRLMKEPRRLWRRYLVDDTAFIWLILKQWLNTGRRNDSMPS